MSLFSLFQNEGKKANSLKKYGILESSLASALGPLFTRDSVVEFDKLSAQFIKLSSTGMGEDWKSRGPEVVVSLIAAVFDFGNQHNFMWRAYQIANQEFASRQEDPSKTDQDEPVAEHHVGRADICEDS